MPDNLRTADDLRDLFSVAMYEKLYNALTADSQVSKVDAAFAVIEAAAEDPDWRLAILNLIGDVAEGAIRVYGDTGHWDVIPVAHAPEARPHVFVVRVRGDATDG